MLLRGKRRKTKREERERKNKKKEVVGGTNERDFSIEKTFFLWKTLSLSFPQEENRECCTFHKEKNVSIDLKKKKNFFEL